MGDNLTEKLNCKYLVFICKLVVYQHSRGIIMLCSSLKIHFYIQDSPIKSLGRILLCASCKLSYWMLKILQSVVGEVTCMARTL